MQLLDEFNLPIKDIDGNDVLIEFSCHLIGVTSNGQLQGELESLSREIATIDGYANCLDAWENCWRAKNLPELKPKILDKYWDKFYQELDGSNNMPTASLFNFNHQHPDFQNLCRFLKSFA